MEQNSTSAGVNVRDGVFDIDLLTRAATSPNRAAALARDNSVVNHEVVAPGSDTLEYVPGICTLEGEPNSQTKANMRTRFQLLGIAKTWLAANAGAILPGDQLVPDTAGRLVKRRKFTSSANLVGFAMQKRTNSASPLAIETLLLPMQVEVVCPITGSTNTTLGAATKYLVSPGAAAANAQVPLHVVDAGAQGGKLRNLRCSLTTAPGGTDTVVFTVQKSSDNGATWVDTTLTCTITGNAKSANDIDESHATAVADGDLIAIKAVSSATTAAGATATVSRT